MGTVSVMQSPAFTKHPVCPIPMDSFWEVAQPKTGIKPTRNAVGRGGSAGAQHPCGAHLCCLQSPTMGKRWKYPTHPLRLKAEVVELDKLQVWSWSCHLLVVGLLASLSFSISKAGGTAGALHSTDLSFKAFITT